MKWFLLFGALSFQARAISPDQLTLQAVLSARSPARVREVLARHDSLMQSRLICKVQLREKIVPTECYRTHALEQALRPRPRRLLTSLARELDDVCRRSAEIAIDSARPEVPPENPYLSLFCRKQLQFLRRALAYRQGGSWSGN